MKLDIKVLEDLVSHYRGVLLQSEAAREALESWGLNVERELRVGLDVEGKLQCLLREGVEKVSC